MTQSRTRQVRKISPPTGFDPLTVHHVASRYTDWATGPTLFRNTLVKKKNTSEILNERIFQVTSEITSPVIAATEFKFSRFFVSTAKHTAKLLVYSWILTPSFKHRNPNRSNRTNLYHQFVSWWRQGKQTIKSLVTTPNISCQLHQHAK